MVTVTPLVGLAYITTGVGLLFLLREPLRHPAKPGSSGFAMAMIGLSLWPLSLGVNYFVADLAVSMALWNIRLFAAALIAVGWFFLTYTLTSGRRPTKRIAAPLLCYIALGVLLSISNPVHQYVLEPGTLLQGTVLVPENGPWFWVQAAVNYGLILGSTALLVTESMRSSGRRRKQAALMAFAVVPPISVNAITIFDIVATPHDLTPFGLAVSGLLLSWVLFRVGFLNVVPVARKVAMANMRDAVITLDTENRVIDCNQAAIELFDPPSNYVDRPAVEFFQHMSRETRDQFATVDAANDEFSTTIAGEDRYFSLSVSPVQDAGETVGRVLVIHDITEIREREAALETRQAELDLLGQVLSRILRHNIRNNLVTIRGHARDIESASEDELARTKSQAILDASESLLDTSEKARAVERIIESDDERVVVELNGLAETVLEEFRGSHPSVSFDVDGDGPCRVRTSRWLETAVDALVENAVKYNHAPNPAVTLRVEQADHGPTLSVVDNGPGIPDHEVEVLERNTESPLTHGSGLGLWLVKWTANASDATLSIEGTETGTVATLGFEETVDESA